MARQLGPTKYTHIRDILLNRRDLLEQTQSSQWSSPVHAHVRCAGYYQ